MVGKSFHFALSEWENASQEDKCFYCLNKESLLTIKEFSHSYLITKPDPCIKGACCLVSQKHFIELFDLPESNLLGFMKEAQVVAKILKKITKAIKINYEIHGNTVPHFHMHLLPRYIDDPFPGKPIDLRKTTPVYKDEEEFKQFVAQFQKEIEHYFKQI